MERLTVEQLVEVYGDGDGYGDGSATAEARENLESSKWK